MPEVSFTSFGHCYYILIIAHLVKSGVSQKDEDINACFNFLEKLAYRTFSSPTDGSDGSDKIEEFIAGYRNEYYISQSLVSRLRDVEYGILTQEGVFRKMYMYYYFLGRYLANEKETQSDTVQRLCTEIHVGDNHLIVLFLVHHTHDDSIIDDVLLDCMDILGDIDEATLERSQTQKFSDFINTIPKNILSEESVDSQRKSERGLRDLSETEKDQNMSDEKMDRLNQLYKMFRSIEILGQILRNRYGTLHKSKVEEMVETIVDGGLRSISEALHDDGKVGEMARYLRKRYSDIDEDEFRKLLSAVLFLWTVANLRLVTNALSIPTIVEAVNNVVRRRDTPAYELVGYFNLLECAEKLTQKHVNEVTRLKKGSKDQFFRMAISLMTQSYMNTHRGTASIEQAMCAALGISYVYRKVTDE